MRERKYRAWDKKKNKFTTDFVIAPTSPTWGAFPIEYSEDLKKYQLLIHEKIGIIDEDWKVKLMGFISSDYTLTDWSNYYGLHNYEIEDFIGIYDKNGKEIYEEDIVNAIIISGWGDLCVKGTIKYIIPDCIYVIEENKKYSYNLQDIKEIEVIGNNHENTDLLKDKLI